MPTKNKDLRKRHNKDYYGHNKERASDRRINRRKSIKDFIVGIKFNSPCADCKRKFPPECMDFDHLGDKKFNLSSAGSHGYSMGKIMEEISKCEIVCACYHRTRTQKRIRNSKVE